MDKMLFKKLRLVIVTINIFLVGCATNSIGECTIENTYEGCYMNINGERALMTCPKYMPALMTHDQIGNSLELFWQFLKSPKVAIALERSMYREEAGVKVDPSKLINEGDEIDMMVGTRFLATMRIRVDTNSDHFVRRFGNPFKKTEEPVKEWERRILTNVLGQGYERFSPSLTYVNNETIGIYVLFSDIHELQILHRKKNLVSIKHIGNPVYALELEETPI